MTIRAHQQQSRSCSKPTPHIDLKTSRPSLVAQSHEADFSLIEVMIVVVILAILATLLAPRVMGRTDDAKRAAAKAQIKILESTLQLYTLDIGLFPSNEQGLKALVEKPTSNPQPANWKAGGYHGKLPSIHGGTTMAIISARLFLLLKPA